ncbi:MAG: fluoride efflux transporter CrcB [Gloeomargarita sp. HHBFW_bins_162]
MSWLPVWIALGAIPGALCRHYMILFCTQQWGNHFPWGTFIVNLSGAILMGFCTTIIDNNIPWLNGLVAIGFIASYTTFSSYALDTSRLWQQKRYKLGLLYFIGSALAGFLGVELGIFTAELVHHG